MAARRARRRASSERVARDDRRRVSLDEVEPLAARPAGRRAPPRQALGYRELLDHLDGGLHARRGRRRRSSPRTRRSPSARSGGSAATRAYAGSTSTDDPVAEVPPVAGGAIRRMTDSPSPSTTASATTSSSPFDPPLPDGRAADARPAVCATGARASAPTACSSATPTPTAPTLGMVLYNADGSRAEMSGNGIRCLAQALAARRGDLGAAARSLTDAGAAPRRAVAPTGRPDDDRGHASTWARSADIAEPAGWDAHRRRPGPAGRATSALGNPHAVVGRRRRRRRRPRSPSAPSVPARQPRDHRARPGAATPSRCGSTSAAPASPRRAAPAPAPAPGPPRRGACAGAADGEITRAHGRRRCQGASAPTADRPRHADRAGHVLVATDRPVDIDGEVHERA